MGSPATLVPVATPHPTIEFAIPELLDGGQGSNRSRRGPLVFSAI